jgi:hypothetical protein
MPRSISARLCSNDDPRPSTTAACPLSAEHLDTPGAPVMHLRAIPTFDEAEAPAPAIRGVLDRAPQTDVLVVDDNSPGATRRIVNGMSAVNQRIRLRRLGEQCSCNRATWPGAHRSPVLNVLGNLGEIVLTSSFNLGCTGGPSPSVSRGGMRSDSPLPVSSRTRRDWPFTSV